MPSTILCGVDTSDAARGVADTAEWLARGLGARLLLLHVADDSQRETDERLASLRGTLSAVAADVRQAEGDPADRLLESVEHDGADLLVVGSRGRGAIRSAVFGSVSRRLATDATCPVVVVPPDVSTTDGSGSESGGPSVVCGIDGSDHSIAAVRLGADLARRLGLRLIVVHALAEFANYFAYPGARRTAPSPSAQPDAARRIGREMVDAAVEAVGGDVTGTVESGLPWDVLLDVADRENARLLVVAARGHSSVRAAFLGSVATRLATNGRHPSSVAILPETAERAWGEDRSSLG